MNFLRKSANTLIALAATAAIFTSCDDTENIGSSLIQSENKIFIEDSFRLTGHSVENRRVQSRTAMELIGSLEARGFGRFRSDFVTQFMPVSALDSNLTSAAAIDSVKLVMMFQRGAFVGDSVIPMGVNVYRLTRQLKAPLFSDFDPADYYDPSAPIGSAVYGASNLGFAKDSLNKLTYREVFIDLPMSLAYELYDVYQQNPSAVLSPTEFAQYFPGIYVESSYGSGRVTQMGASIIRFYYHRHTKNYVGRDTTYYYEGNFFSATPEVLTNNIIAYEMAPELLQRVDRGEQLLVAPAGLDVEIEFPITDVLNYLHANVGDLTVINNLTMSIPAKKIENAYGIEPPMQILMVLKKDREKFFEDSQVTDGITSFYANYSKAKGSYEFSSMREYLLDCLQKADNLTKEDYTFVLTPVTVSSESVYNGTTGGNSNYVNSIVPYIQQPAMTQLEVENAKIIFTFSNQFLKN